MTEPGPAGGRCDTLFVGGAVVTMDDARRVFDPGFVAVRDDRVVAVGPAAEATAWTAARRVDCEGHAVLPGFVDCHTHLFQTLARGLGDGLALRTWLNEFMWPYSLAIEPAEARVAAMVGAIQAVRSGTTCIVDNHYAPSDLATTLAVADAIESVGLRGVVARGIVGGRTAIAEKMNLVRGFFARSAEEELDITRGCLEARVGAKVAIWPAPLNVLYVDQDLVQSSVAVAREFGVRWHTHCCEGSGDPATYVEAHGIRPVAWLAREGLLGDATLAHGIWLDDDEIDVIGAEGTGISHNPVSNGYIGSGVAPVRRLREAGAVVGLGTDGAAVAGQDLLEAMKEAVLVHRLHAGDPTALSVEAALELATRDGARFAGVDSGQLAPGRLADVVVVDLTGAHTRPVHRAAAAVVFAARASDVTLTMIGGQIVFEDGCCLLVDEAAVLEEAQARAGELVVRAGLSALTAPWTAAPSGAG